MNNHLYITIGREIGSGGRIIGERIAKELGIDFLNNEILQKAAEHLHTTEAHLKRFDESSPALFERGLSTSIGYGHPITPPYFFNDELFAMQARIILETAQAKSCVVVGRCANYLLRNYSNTINIFLYGTLGDRKNRLIHSYGHTEEDIEKFIKKADKQRKQFYELHTGQVWGDVKQYDLSIDTSKLGIDKATKLILDYITLRTQA